MDDINTSQDNCSYNTKQLVLQRIEEDIAVCEAQDGTHIEIEVSMLPEDICEGDVLIFEDGRYIIDHAQTDTLRDESYDLFTSIFRKQ